MDDFLKTLLNDLKQTKNNLNRFIAVGLIFSFFGQFYIIEPYYSLKKQEKSVEKEISKLNSKKKALIEEKRKSEIRIKKIKKITETTKREINKLPDQLRDAIYQIRKKLENGNSFSVEQTKRITLPENIKNLEEGVRWYISKWSENLIKNLQREIDKSSDLFDPTEKEKIKNLSAKINKEINLYIKNINPEFWRAYQNKISFAEGLKGVISDQFSPFFEELSGKKENITKSIKDYELEIKNLMEHKEKIQKEKNLLKKRLSSIESPIGKLPINLTDFIKTFPVLIFICGILIAYNFNKNRTYSKYFMKESLNSGIDKSKVMYFVEIYRFKEKTLGIVLILLLAVSVRSSFLIITDKDIFSTISGIIYTEFIFYCFAYLISVAGLIFLIFDLYRKVD